MPDGHDDPQATQGAVPEQGFYALRHLRRSTREGRERAARDPVTQMYLRAGLRLLTGQSPATPADGPDAAETVHPLFAWLSRSKIVDEIRNEPVESRLPRAGTVNGLRDRWDPHRDYIADLLLFALAAEGAVSHAFKDPGLVHTLQQGDLVTAIHALMFQDLTDSLESKTFNVQLAATAVADQDQFVREALISSYADYLQAWRSIARAMVAAKNMPLRNGLSIEALVDIITATGDGLALRLHADPDAPVLDPAAGTSLLGTAVAALLTACVDFTGDGLSVEDALRSKLAQGTIQ